MTSDFTRKPDTYPSLFKAVLLIIPILLHFCILSYFSSNIPWIDDFYWYFEFFRKLDLAKNVSDAFQVTITPYNNHWHILQRLLFVTILQVLGSLNMEWIVFLGNVLFVTLFYFLFLRAKNTHLQVSTGAVAASWLFFQPVSHYNFFECAFFNLPVLLLSFLSIRAFSEKKNSGLFWGILATFSNGNGLLVWPVGLLMALWHRDWKKALQYGLIFAGFVLLYVNLSKGTSSPGKLGIDSLYEVAIYFVQMCGSLANGVELITPWFQTVCGVLMLLGILLITPKALKVNEKLYFFMLFVLMTMGIVALTRKEVNGFSAQIVNHYLMFPQLLLGCLIYFLIKNTDIRPVFKTVLVVFSVMLSLANYVVKLPNLNGHDALKMTNLLNYESQEKWRLYPAIQGKKEYAMVNDVTRFVMKRGYHSPPFLEKQTFAESCSYTINSDGSVLVSAEFTDRIMSKTLVVELTDRANIKTYFPVDPYTSTVRDWVMLKKNRRIDVTLYVNLINEPIRSEDIISCKLLTVR